MRPSGPVPARIAIIGDFPTGHEAGGVAPFNSTAGGKFRAILQEAGILWSSCFVDYLSYEYLGDEVKAYLSPRKTCPAPEWVRVGDAWVHPSLATGFNRVKAELAEVAPTIIVACGPAALLLLTGKTKLLSWRGSRLVVPLGTTTVTVVPCLSPGTLLTQPELAMCFQADLTRVRLILEGVQRPREYKFTTSPTYEQATNTLLYYESLSTQFSPENPLKISIDLETRAGHTACVGLAINETSAICIPFLQVSDASPFYWTEHEETGILWLISRLFSNPNILFIGQNIAYDCQYFYRHWGIVPLRVWDTMIGHHSVYSNTRKGLDFLSSIYAHDHVYWKDEIKEWDPKIGETQYWEYNCKDACITLEISHEIEKVIESKGMWGQADFQQSLFFPVLRMMNRGCRIDKSLRAALHKQLFEAARERQARLDYIVGHPLNPRSSKQLIDFFYGDMGVPAIKNLATEADTTNSPTMQIIADTHPMLQPICQLIVELRSIGVFLSTFIAAELDFDGRMRTAFSIAGPTTYRFNSRENAFGTGMNLQTIPTEAKQKVKGDDYIKLPNVKHMFIPDEGKTFFDLDLDRADLQVVVWEADDSELKEVLRSGIDLHCFNAAQIFNESIPADELKKSHPNYPDHIARLGAKRGLAKASIHAIDYGIGIRKLAQILGVTMAEAESFRERWFGMHPGIRVWQKRVEDHGLNRGYIENAFGARFHTIGRFNLPEALAWIPQSTVARVINTGLSNIDTVAQMGWTSIQLLLQVHDSLAGQFDSSRHDEEIATLKRETAIIIPYPDPLIIPTGIKTSTRSWGHCA